MQARQIVAGLVRNLNKEMKTKNMITPDLRNSISRSPLRLAFLLIPLALGCFALSPAARAVLPAPDGGYPGENTAEGDDALFSLTTGIDNTAIGFNALFSNTEGSFNTAVGDQALISNTTGFYNTANGASALSHNTTGNENTAIGFNVLASNTEGSASTAFGAYALSSNTTGNQNTATGYDALLSNTIGNQNTVNGFVTMYSNTTGSASTAFGAYALYNNTTGGNNTAIGLQALLSNTSGDSNIALGVGAGRNLSTGNNNIDIGNVGVAGDSKRIRIGTAGMQTKTFIAGISGATVASGVAVIVGSNGQLGTVVSSERFKDAIKPMDKASEAILALKPVTFHYRKELDPDGIPQFGLVAEQVEKVDPALVARDADGKVYTVRYEAVNAMLLNEFLKEHRTVEDQKATIAQIKSTVSKQEALIAQQQKGMEVFAAILKEQAAQIQKVSAQVELSKPAARTVLNNQ
jgi:hypothetical protein